MQSPEYKEKTVAYIVLGIVIVIALAVYIYTALSKPITVPSEVATPTNSMGKVVLTPAQSALKKQQLAEINNLQSQPLTPAEARLKAAQLKQFK